MMVTGAFLAPHTGLSLMLIFFSMVRSLRHSASMLRLRFMTEPACAISRIASLLARRTFITMSGRSFNARCNCSINSASLAALPTLGVRLTAASMAAPDNIDRYLFFIISP